MNSAINLLKTSPYPIADWDFSERTKEFPDLDTRMQEARRMGAALAVEHFAPSAVNEQTIATPAVYEQIKLQEAIRVHLLEPCPNGIDALVAATQTQIQKVNKGAAEAIDLAQQQCATD